jgi:hypothetical protein
MNQLMGKDEFFKWLDSQVKNADELRNENPWRAYEAAKGATKRMLCGGFHNTNWEDYDYYQRMITVWAGV